MKINKKWLSLTLVLVLVASVLVGCGEDKEEAPETEDVENAEDAEEEASETEDSDLKIGMVTDEGGVNDQSFNQAAWEGLEKVEEDLGIPTFYEESEQDADYEQNFETLLDNENDLIWGIGYKLADSAYEAALSNPDVNFGVIDFSYDGNDDYPEGTPENLVGVVFADNESSFLAGYIAGKMTETDKIGFVGGNEGDVIWGFDYGFQAGVQYAAKELDKEIKVTSQYANSFSDAAKGKSMATNMFQQGIDIVFHAAGGVGDGVIEAAKEQDKWAIGVDRDQNYLAPDHVLTSVMKRVDVAVYKIAEDLKAGKFEGGKTIRYDLSDDGVGLAPTSDKNVPAEILEATEEVKAKIIDGEIEVPLNEETYEEYIENL